MTAQADLGADSTRVLTILLVEDHEDSCVIVAKLLRREGHNVVTAQSLAEALRCAAAIQFDVLLCDPGLPDGDGRALLGALSKMYPVIGFVLSGSGMPEDIQASLRAGFKAHIIKPFAFTKLLALLKSAMTETTRAA